MKKSLQRWTTLGFLFVGLLATATAIGQERVRKSLDVPRGSGPPVLDGRLDDPQWAQAAKLDDLTLYLPVPGGTPSQRTAFYLYFDDEALYIGAELLDDEPERIIRRQLIQNQIVFNDDHVQIIIDPYDSQRGGYLFYVNPNGVQRDGLLFGENRFNMNWDGIWQAKAHVSEKGWSGEESAWSFREARPTLDATSELRGMQDIEPGRGFDIVPSVVLSDRRRFSPRQSSFEAEPSLDVFYRLSPSMTSSLTINTDFSATEVDDRQVNLSRFSLFFPEKRDFFLQDADIFEFGDLSQNGRPFFSRTIGLSATGEPVDLIGGGKLTGRTGPWILGVFGVRQDDFADVSATTIGVARVQRRILRESTIGGIATSGDPQSNLDNSLLGFDFSFRNTRWIPGKSIVSELWYQRSDTQGIEGGDSAFGLSLRYPNGRINWALGFNEIQSNFNPALGFVNRAGIRSYTGEIEYTRRFDRGWLRSYAIELEADEITDLNDDLETRITTLELAELFTRKGDSFEVYVSRVEEVLRDPFNILGRATVAPGRYQFDRYGMVLNLPAFRTWAATLRLDDGEFFDGDRRDTSVRVRYRPNAHLAMDMSYRVSRIELPDSRFATRVLGLRADIAFNVAWAWINFIQYDNVSGRLGINSRLRWIPKQGQELFLVLNHDFLDQGDRSFRSEFREAAVKFSYTFRY